MSGTLKKYLSLTAVSLLTVIVYDLVGGIRHRKKIDSIVNDLSKRIAVLEESASSSGPSGPSYGSTYEAKQACSAWASQGGSVKFSWWYDDIGGSSGEVPVRSCVKDPETRQYLGRVLTDFSAGQNVSIGRSQILKSPKTLVKKFRY